MNKQNYSTKVLVIAALLQMIWGLVPSASQRVIEEIPIELYVAIRWTIAGAIFGLYVFLKKEWSRLSRSEFFSVSALGIVGYGLGSLGTLYGLKMGGVVNFALMGSLGPVVTSLVAIWILNERPHRTFLMALPLVVLGLFLLIAGKYQISSFAVAAGSSILLIGACTLEALVLAFSKRFKDRMSPAQYLAIAQISAAVSMWMLQATSFHQGSSLSKLSPMGIVSIVYVSVVACVLCYSVLHWLLRRMEGHRLALFDGLHTLSAVLFGHFLFQESFRPLMLMGGLLILGGVIAGNLPRRIKVR